MTALKLPAEGGCRCGKIRLEITRAPIMVTACHCRGCQRMTSSAYSLTAIFPDAGFEVVQGEPVLGGLHGVHKHFFCDHCKSWLFTRPEGMVGMVNVRPTMFDDATWAAPFVDTCAATKLPWATTGAKYSYDEWPPESDYPRLMQEFAAQ